MCIIIKVLSIWVLGIQTHIITTAASMLSELSHLSPMSPFIADRAYPEAILSS